MGINDPSEIEANLQIGPTDQGMVRLYIFAGELEIPMDFTPEEAEEIAEELRAAAQVAATASGGGDDASRAPKQAKARGPKQGQPKRK